MNPGRPSRIEGYEIRPLGDIEGDFTGLHLSMVTVLPRAPSKELHRHDDDAELWLIAGGRGLVTYDGGKELGVRSGDVIFCPKGGEHHIANTGEEVLSVFNIHMSLGG
jgi:mannose-6-phosphate isomerase-like protein (cupin superfamily)